MKRRTLTNLLFLRITPIILAVIAVIGVLAFYSASREINEVYDTQLKNNAGVLWHLVEQELQENESPGAQKAQKAISADSDEPTAASAEEDRYGDARMFRIWNGKQLVMFSDTAFPPHIPRAAEGFSNVTYQDEPWRIYAHAVPHTAISIEVGEKKSLRAELVGNILVDLFVPLLIVIPLIGMVLWLGIRSGLDVTRALVVEIQSRSPDDLSPISAEHLPRDLAPLGHSINKLFIKLAHSIHSERRFADHAAHQLRTPLAGSKLLIQMLSSADSEQERKLILDDLAASNEQSANLVNKLLIGARISHQPLTLHAIRLAPAIAQVIADMAPNATQKSLRLALEGDEAISVMADDTLLSLLIGNLIENAIKYSPDTGTVHVTIAADTEENIARITIRDQGPGIPEAERQLVFERFYRGDAPNIDGAGLGLAIVAEIIERLGGRIALATPEEGAGLQVEITLPRA